MRLHIYGGRGSFPIPAADPSAFGVNTSCYLLDCGFPIILDAGTGILQCGRDLNTSEVHILLSHLHLDHIQGLPGFLPLMNPECHIHIYGEAHDGKSAEELLNTIIAPPFWPVRLNDFPAHIHWHSVTAESSFAIRDAEILPVRVCHPDNCLGYIIRQDGISFAYLTDCEWDLTNPAPKIDILRGIDAALMDAAWLPGQGISGWGHSSWKECAFIARQAEIRTVILSHLAHDPSDELLKGEEKQLPEGCIFVREGMTITI